MSSRAVSKKSNPHHRPSRRARDRILEAADQWARLDGWPASDSSTGCDVVDKLIETARENDLHYNESRALLETLIDRAPKRVLSKLLEVADAEIECFEGVQREEAKYADIAAAVGCSIPEAEKIYKAHQKSHRDHVRTLLDEVETKLAKQGARS